VDVLKIAREFVGPADRSEEWAFAAAIIALGRTLGLTIVAEGIETPGQLERLQALGCAYGQGYLFARPVDAETTLRFLRAGGSHHRISTDGRADSLLAGPIDNAAGPRPSAGVTAAS
jgi:EAL domain-containing protein (putative c-di-GMP-specific phosphodiesterase class I)